MMPIAHMSLADVMDRDVLAAQADSPLRAMVERMRERHVSHVVVLDGVKSVGIFTERDLVRLLSRPYDPEAVLAGTMSKPVATVPATLAFRAAYVQLCLSRLRHLVVVDGDGKVVGVATERDFLGHLGMELCRTVQHLSPLIDRSVPRLPAAAPVSDAVACMVADKRGCIVVVDGDRPLGIFTEQHAPTVLARHADGSAMTLAEVMHREAQTIPESGTVAEAIGLLVMERLGYLVVVDAAGRLCGVIAQSQLLENVRATIHAEVASRQLADAQIRSTEESLAQSRNILKTIIDTAPIRVFWKDRDLRYLGCNPAFAKDAGLAAPDDLIGKDDYQMGWADQAELYRADDRQIINSGVPKLAFEEPQTTPDGRTIWLRTSKVPLRNEDGDTIGVLGIYEDITERKNIEAALRQSEARYRAAFETSVDAVNINRLSDGLYIEVNQGFLNITGYRREEVVGRTSREINVWEDPADRARLVEALERDGHCSDLEARFRKKSGEVLWGLMSASLMEIDGVPCILSVTRDVTALHRADEALRESEANFRSFFDTIDDFLFVLDAEGRILRINRIVVERLGYTEENLAGHPVLDIHPPERRGEAATIVAEMLSGKGDFCPVPLLAADGRQIPVETHVVRGQWNGATALFYVSRDISERERILRALQEEALRRDILLAQTQDGIALLRTDGSLAECNPAFAQMLGYAPDELLEMSVWNWDIQLPRHEIEPAFRNHGLTHLVLQTRHRRKNGTQYDVEVSVNGVDLAGQRYLFCLHRDITARKLAEERLRESEFFLRESQRLGQLGGWRADPVRNTVMWTEGVYEIVEMPLDYRPDLDTALDFYLPESRARVVENLTRTLTCGDPFSIEVQVRGNRSGRDKWTELRGFPHWDAEGQIDYLMGTLQDITARKLSEAAIIEERRRAEAASLAKSQFLATMSHEIRTPLNGILGMAQLLLMPGLEPDEYLDYAHTILNSGQTLLTLLNDILDFSKVEAGKLQLVQSAFDPAQLVHETAALFAGPAQAKGLAVEAAWLGPPGRRYRADPIRLRQMLSNLINNAVKFTDRGGVHVDAREIDTGERTVLLEFSVRDSGIGVPADKRSHLFKPFSQVDRSTTREYGGTGLGLSIVRSLAELMGGSVGVDSQAGIGSRFWFQIRAERLDAGCDSRHDQRAGAVGQRREAAPASIGHILVVEDNPTNQRVITALLDKLGMRTNCVDNGRLAVEALMAGTSPDLVLMDVQMPEMDGIEATRRIRAWEHSSGHPPVPIVALTAGVFTEDRERCLAAGMDDFLGKPLGFQDLKAALAKWLDWDLAGG